MRDAILRKARQSADLELRFFEENAAGLEACVRALAARFAAGGRLLCMGNGGSACDAQHVAVEFLHPIIEKRRALPALALSVDTAALTAIANDTDFARVFADQLELLGRPGDAALGISTSGASANVNRALRRARELGLLTIGFAGRDGGQMAELCDHCFVVGTWSIHRIQETHTLLLHLLWDQVHIAMGEDDVL
ncbi:MAG TPA: SIS domain-containing protein [Candidatus Acidoferrum sp.]|nr:SIS domain-containing protein [Candidatus Acidoferrum sp.]